MFTSVLIANRGEIACRIARTAKRLGLRTIAVYSDADANALHVRSCDEAYRIGPAPARESYLVIDAIIEAARKSRAQCIHPGYGFLSEKPEFAEACAQAGIVFVGPPPDAIRAMGLKDRAKALMEKAGVPVVPGYHGEQQDPKLLKRKAYEIGYPALIKAVAGGGGKGMRRVDRHADFDEALESAMREAASSFGDERVLIEKYVSAPRHIEIQVFADQHGNAIHLNERDCSLQRRHQKVIEEAPAPGMTDEIRASMGAAAVAAAKAVGYVGAGTVEFIADGASGLKPNGFWFMEMNTRLQVEHPVTECVTGQDLVEWQFRVASGEPLPLTQDDVPLRGHAVEARLYAEDPERGFLPSTGKLAALEFYQGDGIRVDTGVEAGGEVSPYYDPMIAKVIASAPTREKALDRLADALDRTLVAGPRTNLAFLAGLCRAWDFRAGDFDTGFIDRNLEAMGAVPQKPDPAVIASGVAHLLKREEQRVAARRDPELPASPWDQADGFQLSGAPQHGDAGRRRRKKRQCPRGLWRGRAVGADGRQRRRSARESRRERGGRLRPAQRPTDRDASGQFREHRRRAFRRRRHCARADARKGSGAAGREGRRRHQRPARRRRGSDEDGTCAGGAERRRRRRSGGESRRAGRGRGEASDHRE